MSRTGRRGGALRANTYRLNHGLYSRHISVRDDEEMKNMAGDKTVDELALCRVKLCQCLDRQEQAASADEWLAWEAVIQVWMGKISNIIHRNAILGKDTRTAFVTILDYIRVNNDRQGVK